MLPEPAVPRLWQRSRLLDQAWSAVYSWGLFSHSSPEWIPPAFCKHLILCIKSFCLNFLLSATEPCLIQCFIINVSLRIQSGDGNRTGNLNRESLTSNRGFTPKRNRERLGIRELLMWEELPLGPRESI